MSYKIIAQKENHIHTYTANSFYGASCAISMLKAINYKIKEIKAYDSI